MQGIEFETDNASSSPQKNIPTEKTSAMVELLLKFGVRDTSTANYILLGTAGILFGTTIFFYAGVLGEQKKEISFYPPSPFIIKNKIL